MSESISVNLRPLKRESDRLWTAAALTVTVACAIMAAQYSWTWAAVPLVASICMITMLWPRVGLVILITALYIRIDLPIRRGIYAADVLAVLVIIGVFAGRALRGERLLERSWINPLVLTILLVLGVSLLQAYDPPMGLINWLRHAQLFLLLLAVASGTRPNDDRFLIKWMLLSTGCIALINIAAFVASGGTLRVFGLPGPFYALYTVFACLHCAIGFITSSVRSRRLLWGGLFLLYFGALIATQTRAAMIQMFFGLILLMGVAWFWARHHRNRQLARRIVVLLITLTVLVTILVAGAIPFLENPSNRIIQALEGRSPTVAYRLFLWKTGIHAFLDSPILGMGLGQVAEWDRFLPQWRFDPVSIHTRGLGAHNDFITYLAETGTIGTLSMFWLFWMVVSAGPRRLVHITTTREFARMMQLWVPAVTIIIGYFFSTHMFYSLSGMMTAVYFGMWIRYTRRFPIENNNA